MTPYRLVSVIERLGHIYGLQGRSNALFYAYRNTTHTQWEEMVSKPIKPCLTRILSEAGRRAVIAWRKGRMEAMENEKNRVHE